MRVIASSRRIGNPSQHASNGGDLLCNVALQHHTPTTMPSQRDLEGGSVPDERAPLLSHDAARQHTPTPSESDEIIDQPEKAASKTWYYVWRGILAVFAILVVAVFIKGWIEADDVDVCPSAVSRYIQTPKAHSMHSSISKAH